MEIKYTTYSIKNRLLALILLVAFFLCLIILNFFIFFMTLSFSWFALIQDGGILVRNERSNRCYGASDRQDREGPEAGGGTGTLYAEKSLHSDRIQEIRSLPAVAVDGE